jgi:UDP-N-acetylglucosamine--N-acetylmuramyl-(pentapeptide) pyrophosphoryl-undecaprenol N-acetylglucosamine transferase
VTLLVCSGGGHLKQLQLLLPRLGLSRTETVWATFDTALSRSLIGTTTVVFIPYTAPRDVVGTIRNTPWAMRLLREWRIDMVISTGANPALAFMPAARLLNKPCHFIESATRTRGPSLTGAILRWIPGVHLYTQSNVWATRKWVYLGSVFDNFESRDAHEENTPIGRIVVTVGTTETYGFRRLVEKMSEIIPRGVEVLWQTGATITSGLPISARPSVPAAELAVALRRADVVVAHAGTGSALAALECGKCPVLIPRRRQFAEHVDDHQVDTAAELELRKLAIVRSVEGITFEDLKAAARRTVLPLAAPPAIRLVGLN